MGLSFFGRSDVAASVAMGALSITAVSLRVYVRKASKMPLRRDDIAICIALVLAITLSIMGVVSAAKGWVGGDLATISLESERSRHKMTYVDVILMCITLTIIKLSILLFYKEIFSTRRFKMAANFFAVLQVMWGIVTAICQIVSTKPVDAWWNWPAGYDPRLDHGKNRYLLYRFNYAYFLVGMSASNMFLDICILALPLFVIRKLHMSTAKKISLIAVFGAGAFCVIAAAIRLQWTIEFSQLTRGLRNPAEQTKILTWNYIWAKIEVNASVVAACLPTLAPLVKTNQEFFSSLSYHLRSYRVSLRSLLRSRSTSGDSSASEKSSQADSSNSSSFKHNTQVSVSHEKRNPDGDEGQLLSEPGQIHVIRSFGYQHETSAV